MERTLSNINSRNKLQIGVQNMDIIENLDDFQNKTVESLSQMNNQNKKKDLRMAATFYSNFTMPSPKNVNNIGEILSQMETIGGKETSK